jgi:hypothetical protein
VTSSSPDRDGSNTPGFRRATVDSYREELLLSLETELSGELLASGFELKCALHLSRTHRA